jgi:hypothetical protein
MPENMHWKLPLNLKTLKDMGEAVSLKREQDRANAIKIADKICYEKNGSYLTQEEYLTNEF